MRTTGVWTNQYSDITVCVLGNTRCRCNLPALAVDLPATPPPVINFTFCSAPTARPTPPSLTPPLAAETSPQRRPPPLAQPDRSHSCLMGRQPHPTSSTSSPTSSSKPNFPAHNHSTRPEPDLNTRINIPTNRRFFYRYGANAPDATLPQTRLKCRNFKSQGAYVPSENCARKGWS
jgi:hypothetical protein